MPHEPAHAWDRLVAWANRHDLTVRFSAKSTALEADGTTITINRYARGQSRVYDLAHECGHALCGHRWDLHWRHNLIREELDAWDAGRWILRSLRCPPDPWAWEQHVAYRLKLYFAWAAKRVRTGRRA